MPFTLSHPALVLPLKYLPNRWFSMTGLIIGSLTPDFEYFFRMSTKSIYSHPIVGLFWFDLPLGILLCFLYHDLIRNSLFEDLPRFLRSRFSNFKQFAWNEYFKSSWIIIILSIFIGGVSHIFWDSFTHAHGYFVQFIPALSNKVSLFGWQIPIFKVLQHASSLIGGLVILFAIARIPIDIGIRVQFNLKYWSLIILITCIIIFLRFFNGIDLKSYGNIFMTIISAGLIGLTLTSLLIRRKT